MNMVHEEKRKKNRCVLVIKVFSIQCFTYCLKYPGENKLQRRIYKLFSSKELLCSKD